MMMTFNKINNLTMNKMFVWEAFHQLMSWQLRKMYRRQITKKKEISSRIAS